MHGIPDLEVSLGRDDAAHSPAISRRTCRTNKAIAERLAITSGAARKHVAAIFGKLRLPDSDDDHRRILAVLAYLQPARQD